MFVVRWVDTHVLSPGGLVMTNTVRSRQVSVSGSYIATKNPPLSTRPFRIAAIAITETAPLKKLRLFIVCILLLSGCASTPEFEWRLQPDGSYFHCVAGTDQCDTQFKAYRDSGVMI